MSLKSINEFNSSKQLPFPTSKFLEVREGNVRPFDVMQNDLSISQLGDVTIISSPEGNYL